MLEQNKYNRYQRQLLLEELGEAGQQKLLQTRVVVVGAGGLGCPALQYLAAAGVGTIGIVDDDIVALSNLHRQVLYKTSDVGRLKVACAAAFISALNPDVCIETYNIRLTNYNAMGILKSYDIVIDGTDNFATRYMINDACALLQKPMVYAGISTFEGQLAVFHVADAQGQIANYRDLFPQPPAPSEVTGCNEAGVIGVLPGIIGTMQASETIKLITGIGQPLINRLLTFNALTNSTYILQLASSKNNEGPDTEAAFLQMDYPQWCQLNNDVLEINQNEFERLRNDPQTIIIDVRELTEQPRFTASNLSQIPMSQLYEGSVLPEGDTVVLFCQSGARSRTAVQLLRERYGSSKTFYSLAGGIAGWKVETERII